MMQMWANMLRLEVTSMKQPQGLGSELDRMNTELDFDPEEFQAREALYQRHVADLVALLRAPVRQALLDEGHSVDAGEWVSHIERLEHQHFASPIHSADEGLAGARNAQGDLGQRLREAVASVSDAEVEGHATQLAQLLLSNWLGLLEHAMQDHPNDGVLELDADGLPMTANLDAVLQGAAAYVLSPEAAAIGLRQYREGFAVGSITALSPTLQLVRGQRGWHVARTQYAGR